MNEETIRGEAGAALDDLELDSIVSNVAKNGKNWCIQFSDDYGQFCDSFQNQFERDNSPRVIREKIKKYLLGQVTQLRNKGKRRTSRKGFDEPEVREAGEMLQEALTETTRAVGEALNQTLGVTGATIESALDVAETVSARTAEMLKPARSGKRARPAPRSPKRKSAPVKSTKKSQPGSRKRKTQTKKAKSKKAKVKRG